MRFLESHVLNRIPVKMSRGVLVTAYYDLYGKPARFWEYFDLFYEVAASGLPVIVFTDPGLVRKFRFLPDTCQVVAAPLDSFELYRMAAAYTGELPTHRDPAKDTPAFFGLMVTKAEMLARAKALRPEYATYFWHDFGLAKIYRKVPVETVITRLRLLVTEGQYVTAGGFPGCWTEGRPFSVDHVHWRFCGGFFFLPAGFVDRFFEHVRNVHRDMCTMPMYKLTWETNVFTLISVCAEESDRAQIHWYYADHDEGMILHAPLSLLPVAANESS